MVVLKPFYYFCFNVLSRYFAPKYNVDFNEAHSPSSGKRTIIITVLLDLFGHSRYGDNTWRPSVRLERSSALSAICTVSSNLQTIFKDTPILTELLFVVSF